MPETVRGPVAELGVTLMHEHVFGLSPEILWNWPDIPEGWDLEARAGQAAAKLEALRAAGIDTIVDLTVVGLGRYVPRRATGGRADRGEHRGRHRPLHLRRPAAVLRQPRPRARCSAGPTGSAEFFVRDITEGIGGTGVKAASSSAPPTTSA